MNDTHDPVTVLLTKHHNNCVNKHACELLRTLPCYGNQLYYRSLLALAGGYGFLPQKIFKTTFKKTRVTKSGVFKENAETHFCLNIEVERKETKTMIVYKNSNIMSIQHKTINTISFAVAANFFIY